MIELGLFILGLIGFLILLWIPILGPIIIFQFSELGGIIAGIIQLLIFLGYIFLLIAQAIANAVDKINIRRNKPSLYLTNKWKDFSTLFQKDDYRYKIMTSSIKNQKWFKKKTDAFFESAMNIAHSDSKEKQWRDGWHAPSLTNFWGAYGEL